MLRRDAEYLHHEGLVPIVVPNATHALRLASSVDVVVTGLLLPGEIDGIELLARLRRDARTRAIPIVVLTACAWRSDRDRALAAGCDCFLSKPCLPCTLLDQLRRLVREGTFSPTP